MARREERAYREYVSDEQRSQPRGPQRGSRVGVEEGCPARELCDESRLRDTSCGSKSAPELEFDAIKCELPATFCTRRPRRGAGGATAPGRAADGESRTDSTTGRWPGAAPVREGAHRGIRPGAARWAGRRTHAGGTRRRL